MNILLSLLVSSVYIFNAQGQYLCIGEDGTPMLSDAPVSLEVTRGWTKSPTPGVSTSTTRA